jgi:hypothetical protein
MDARVGSGDFPAMGPLADEPRVDEAPPEPGQDYLVGVADPAGARTALDTADRLVLLDGRATAWQVVDRLAMAGFYGTLMVAAAYADGGYSTTAWWVVGLAAVLFLVVSSACSRRVGMTLSGRERSLDVLAWGAVVVVVLWWALAERSSRGLVVVPALLVVAFAFAPVVRWRRAIRRATGIEGWPPGAQAFALTSVLARAGAVAPDRLIALAGLTPVNGDRWVERLRAEQAVSGGRRRHWVLGDERVRLTPPGHERLHRMREELERVAAGMPAG